MALLSLFIDLNMENGYLHVKDKNVGLSQKDWHSLLKMTKFNSLIKQAKLLKKLPYEFGTFDSLPAFSSGFAALPNARKDGKNPWGFVDQKGNMAGASAKFHAPCYKGSL